MTIQAENRLRAIPTTAGKSTALKTESLGIAPTPADSLGDALAAGVNRFSFHNLSVAYIRLRHMALIGKPMRFLAFDIYCTASYGLDGSVYYLELIRARGMGAL